MRVRPLATGHVTSDVEKAFRKLPTRIQDLAERKDQWFRANAFDPRLRTHQLKGSLEGFWSYSVNDQYRVLFRFLATGGITTNLPTAALRPSCSWKRPTPRPTPCRRTMSPSAPRAKPWGEPAAEAVDHRVLSRRSCRCQVLRAGGPAGCGVFHGLLQSPYGVGVHRACPIPDGNARHQPRDGGADAPAA